MRQVPNESGAGEQPKPWFSPEQRVLEALAEAGVAITNERQLSTVLDRLLVAAIATAEADEGSVMLLSPDRNSLVVVAARGPRAALIQGYAQPVERSIAGRALREERPVMVHGVVRHDSSGGVQSDNPQDLASAIAVRLESAGQVLGVLNVSRGPTGVRMEERTQLMMDVLAQHAAILIANVQMIDALRLKEERLEQLVDRLLRESGRRTPTSIPLEQPLTKREQDVLTLVVEGLTNREIGAQLFIEADTVKDHIERITKKLFAVDRTHAAAIAIRGGLVK